MKTPRLPTAWTVRVRPDMWVTGRWVVVLVSVPTIALAMLMLLCPGTIMLRVLYRQVECMTVFRPRGLLMLLYSIRKGRLFSVLVVWNRLLSVVHLILVVWVVIFRRLGALYTPRSPPFGICPIIVLSLPVRVAQQFVMVRGTALARQIALIVLLSPSSLAMVPPFYIRALACLVCLGIRLWVNSLTVLLTRSAKLVTS